MRELSASAKLPPGRRLSQVVESNCVRLAVRVSLATLQLVSEDCRVVHLVHDVLIDQDLLLLPVLPEKLAA